MGIQTLNSSSSHHNSNNDMNSSSHSTCSTMSVASPKLSTQQNKKNKSIRKKKRVQFVEGQNKYHFPNSQKVVDQSSATTWYQSVDYLEFRFGNQQAMETLSEDHAELEKELSKTLKAVWKLVGKVDYCLDKAHKLKGSSVLVERLATLFRQQEELVGLEDYLCPKSVRRSMRSRRESLQEVVLDIQNEVHQGLWMGHPEAELDAEYRDSCTNYSQCACLYSQLVATARWKANDDDSSKSDNSIKMSKPCSPSLRRQSQT